jgi:hypothetical protein
MKTGTVIVCVVLFLTCKCGLSQEKGVHVPSSAASRYDFQCHSQLHHLYGNTHISQEYLELTYEQILEMNRIRREFEKMAGEIQSMNNLSYEEKVAKLKELAPLMDDELRGILAPNQLERLNGLKQFYRIKLDGLVNSMVNGWIASDFQLSIAERKVVKRALEEMSKEYREAQDRSHEKAISRLIESFPKHKRERFKETLELMRDREGRLIRYNDLDLNTDQGLRATRLLGLLEPLPLDESSEKEQNNEN